MADNEALGLDTYRRAFEFLRIGSEAVQKAQEGNRRLGIPNAYSRNGRIDYELPNGEITYEDPFKKDGEE